MNCFSIAQKPPIYFGENVSGMVGEKFRELGCSNIFVVCDPYLNEIGSFQHIYQSLDQASLTYTVSHDFDAEPTDVIINDIAKKAVGCEVDGILGVGGGSAMDIAKCVNTLIHSEFPVNRYLGGKETPAPGVPLILIPTTTGTGSEVSCAAVFGNSETNVKTGFAFSNTIATMALIDPAFIRTMPPKLIGASGLDTLSHAAEAITSGKRNPFSDAYAEMSIKFVWKYLEKAMEDPEDLDVDSYISIAGSAASMAFTDATTHIGHTIAHAIGAQYHIPHGECCAMTIAQLLRFLADKMPEEIKRIAACMGIAPESAELGREISKEVIRMSKASGLRSAFKCGITRDFLVSLVPYVKNVAANHPGAPEAVRQATDKDLEQLLIWIYEA